MSDPVTNNETPLTDAYMAGKESADVMQRLALLEHATTGAAVPVRFTEEDGGSRVELATDVAEYMERNSIAPLRRKGNTVLAELGTFVEFVNRYKSEHSAIYADIDSMSLVCVFNEAPGGAGGGAAWRDHRAIYAAPRSPAWIEWTRLDAREMDQDTFADFLEAHLEHLITGRDVDGKHYPAPTEVLQMARDLTVLTKGTFKRSINPTNGSTILECKNEEDTGSTVIPRAFLIAIPVFDGGAPYQVECRIRMQMTNGRPMFRYQMHRRTEIERDAFMETRIVAADITQLPLYAGKAG
jgi:uncharacterized protein YfdQ (DUF2303 family)